MNPKHCEISSSSQMVYHLPPVMDRRRRPSSSPTKSSKSSMYTNGTFGLNRNADMLLNDKERQLAELQRQLQETLAERNDLKIRLKTVEDEVEELKKTSSNYETSTKKQKERIAMLENDRTTLQVQLRTVQAEIINLAKQNEDRKEENRRLNEKLQKVENKNGELQEEVNGLKKAIAPNFSEQTVALLHLGELCHQIQNFIFKKILPDHYNSWENYQVEAIEKYINDPSVEMNKKEREKAVEKLQKLKDDFHWNEGLGGAVTSLQKSRNDEAHPRIDETSLRKHAKTLNDQKQLRGRFSLQRLNEMINIWKSLK